MLVYLSKDKYEICMKKIKDDNESRERKRKLREEKRKYRPKIKLPSTSKLSVKRYYCYYYKLLIKLLIMAKKEGVYDFIDYGDYIRSFIKNIFRTKRSNDDE